MFQYRFPFQRLAWIYDKFLIYFHHCLYEHLPASDLHSTPSKILAYHNHEQYLSFLLHLRYLVAFRPLFFLIYYIYKSSSSYTESCNGQPRRIFLELPSYGIYISQLVRFARCCTSVLDFHSKNLQITSKLLTQGYRYHKLRKTFGKFFRSYSELLSKFGDISFQEYVFKGISHPVFYGDLVYKLRRVKDTPNFISSGSKIVKRLRRRQYDPLIIETTIGLVLGPCTALCRLFLKHCTLTNKAVGTIWRALSKPPQRRQGPDLRPLWLLVGTPSAIRPELAFSRAEHSLPYSDVTIYIFAILYLSSMLYVYRFLWPLRLGWLLVCCLYKEVYLQIFKCMSFWLHGCCG